MTRLLISLLATLFLQQPQIPVLTTAVPPAPVMISPFNDIVVLKVQPGAGGEVQQADALAGAAPFVESTIPAVKNWKFKPATEGGPLAPASVTMIYRTREIFNFDSTPEFADWLVNGDRPPLPRSISIPGYPPASVAEGVVILQLRISAAGAVERVDTVVDVPGLTDAARVAAGAWKFWPASLSGMPAPGTAIVGISFLRPIV